MKKEKKEEDGIIGDLTVCYIPFNSRVDLKKIIGLVVVDKIGNSFIITSVYKDATFKVDGNIITAEQLLFDFRFEENKICGIKLAEYFLIKGEPYLVKGVDGLWMVRYLRNLTSLNRVSFIKDGLSPLTDNGETEYFNECVPYNENTKFIKGTDIKIFTL